MSEWGRNPILFYLLGQFMLAAWVFPPIDWWYFGAPLWLAGLECAVMLAGLSLLAVFMAKRNFVVSL